MSNADWLGEISKFHKQWIRAAKACGAGELAEDCVQDTYLKLHKYADPEKIFKDGVLQKGYVFFAIKSVVATHHKNNSQLFTSIPKDLKYVPPSEEEAAWLRLCEKLDKKVDEKVNGNHWSPGDKRVFNEYRFSDDSIRSIGKVFDVCYITIFHKLKECKMDIREEMEEDYQDYINQDFELI